jgi:S-adenosylmethionine:tRNA-ribosyltransferase-isomerase (queuine synthetase)
MPPSEKPRRAYTRSDFEFDLPSALIAQYPLPERTASRLLHVVPSESDAPMLTDRVFKDLPQLIAPDDLLVFNDTKVIKARLFGKKADSGGRVEMLIERLMGDGRALVQMRASHMPKAGAVITFHPENSTGDGQSPPASHPSRTLSPTPLPQAGEGNRTENQFSFLAGGESVRSRPSQGDPLPHLPLLQTSEGARKGSADTATETPTSLPQAGEGGRRACSRRAFDQGTGEGFYGSCCSKAGAMDNARAIVLGRQNRFFEVRFEGTGDLVTWLNEHGQMPLPPYIRRVAEGADDARYQTVYARVPGAVAAPTAGLHFDEALLAALDAHGVRRATVTLHVGAGTFQPVQHEDLSHHVMHREMYEISAATATAIKETRARGGRVVAVGTTSLRALESAADDEGTLHVGHGETALFITPGYRFKVVDRLLTNFHLSGSTLLMLVAAFGGYETMRTAYAHAVDAQYRFFSYGDAMLLERS